MKVGIYHSVSRTKNRDKIATRMIIMIMLLEYKVVNIIWYFKESNIISCKYNKYGIPLNRLLHVNMQAQLLWARRIIDINE